MLDMKIKSIFIIAFIMLVSQPVFAIKVSGLYQTTVPVSDESAPVRNKALKQALTQVLIKLTGDRNINSSSNVEPLLEKSERFVQQFRYRQVTTEGESTLELQVNFDETALNEALRSYGITIWSNERPAILVWMAYEGTEGRQMVSFEAHPEYLEMLDKRASARGLSLLFPLLDLEDTARISVSDVWGGFKEPILGASQRYDADVILTGKLTQIMPALWEAQWTAYIDDQVQNWSSQGQIADMALEEGIDELADRLASRYASVGSTQAEVIEIEVVDINNVDEYARTLSYLEGLQSVSSVQVKHVYPDKVIFELISLGGQAVIDQAIGLGNVLEPVISTKEGPSYRLLPR